MSRNQPDKDRNRDSGSSDEFRKHLKEMESYQRRYEKLKSQCNHQKSNGKYKIEVIRAGIVKCKQCGTPFDITPVPESKVNEALDLFFNMGNQMKLLSKPEEIEFVKKIGLVMCYIKDYTELYKKTLETNGVKKRKARRDESDTYGGRTGMDKLAFNQKH